MEGQNFFVYSNENEGIFVLVLYSYIHISEFIIGKKHKVLGSKAKLWGLGAKPQPPEAKEGLGAPPKCLAIFCNFLIKIPHFET